jgi:hypothetical protein
MSERHRRFSRADLRDLDDWREYERIERDRPRKPERRPRPERVIPPPILPDSALTQPDRQRLADAARREGRSCRAAAIACGLITPAYGEGKGDA